MFPRSFALAHRLIWQLTTDLLLTFTTDFTTEFAQAYFATEKSDLSSAPPDFSALLQFLLY